jgi:hypothetical protein
MSKDTVTVIKRKGKSPLRLAGKIALDEAAFLTQMLNEPQGIDTKAPNLPKRFLVDISQDELEAMFEEEVPTAGDLIRRAKELEGVSQRALAERVNVQNPRVAQIQKAGNAIEIPTLARYAQAMGFDLEIAFVPKKSGKRLVTKLRTE